MKFNKLYYILAKNLINQNKEFQKTTLQKGGFNDEAIQHIFKFLKDFDNKTSDFLARYIATREIKDVTDNRIQKVQSILELKPSIDAQNWKGTLNQFIQKYEYLIKQSEEKIAAKTLEFLDKIPQFSQKKEYPNGVVIYKVEDSPQAQQAVRKIVDLQWGRDSNPWCIVSRKNLGLEGNYNNYWLSYNGYPKHIAFQNGQLLAFYAGHKDEPKPWWGRMDEQHTNLPLLDGSEMNVGIFEWNNEQLSKLYLQKHPELKYNESTGRYDTIDNSNIRIEKEDLIGGFFPVKFGNVGGDFICTWCDNLVSLQGAPEYVRGNFSCSYCIKLTTLIGGPKSVDGDFYCNSCIELKNLEGAPKYVGGAVSCNKCVSLESIQGAPNYIGKKFISVRHCSKLNAPGDIIEV